MPRTKLPIERTLALNIERCLGEQGSSLKVLAAHSGVALTDLEQILQGKRSVDMGELERLAASLHVSEAQLLARTHEPKRSSRMRKPLLGRRASEKVRAGRNIRK
jgi:transcriptional regulator with XRE-family HTH domain